MWHPRSQDALRAMAEIGRDRKRSIIEAVFEKIEVGDGKIAITYSGIPTSEELCKNQQQMAPARC